MSHPIRGSKGNNATDKDMKENNKLAIAAGNRWQKILYDAFGGPVDVYIPGEHDEFVLIAYRSGYLTEEQILSTDCQILDTCDMLLALNEDCISKGMRIEIDYALDHDIPVLYISGGKIKKPFDPATLKVGDRIRVKYPENILDCLNKDLEAANNIATVKTLHSYLNHDVIINGHIYGCSFDWMIGWADQ